jgi:large subunit ribosomal protein L31
MKNKIHPKYYPDAVIKCICGNKMTIGSTAKETEVEICANCHPFFSGKEKLIDTAGRVEKFRQKIAKAKILKSAKPTPKVRVKKTVEEPTLKTKTTNTKKD